MKNTMIAIVLTLIVAGGGGYVVGKGAVDTSASDKDLQEAITMMKEQSASIKKMGEMMKASGMSMQEFGTKYNDDMMMSKGKDMEMLGAKYMQEDAKATSKDSSMNQMMD